MRGLGDRIVEGGACFGFAATAAIRTTRACLQVGKTLHTVGGCAADVVVGNGVAQADVHGAHLNTNANDCQQIDARRF